MPSSPLDVVDEELARYRQHQASLEASLREVGVKIEVLEKLRPRLAEIEPARPARHAVAARTGPPDLAAPTKPPIRALVREVLQGLEIFSTMEMVAAVRAIRDDAKESSIRSELSHAKGRGEIAPYGNDRYRSCLYEAAKPTENRDDGYTLLDDVSDSEPQETSDGPGPEFGRLIARY